MGKQLMYTALGDSITGGWGASCCYGFAYRFCDYLKYKCCCKIKCENFGCPGITSGGLLRQLKRSYQVRCAVKNADIITITIGGNNLLKCACNNYKCIRKRLCERRIEGFASDWPEILYVIREELCSKAQIYVMTVYNPYSCCDNNYEIADYCVNEINSVIMSPILIQDYGYFVVDAYTDFENNARKRWTFFNNCIFRDPHPNWEGHRRIFCAFRKEYERVNACGNFLESGV